MLWKTNENQNNYLTICAFDSGHRRVIYQAVLPSISDLTPLIF